MVENIMVEVMHGDLDRDEAALLRSTMVTLTMLTTTLLTSAMHYGNIFEDNSPVYNIIIPLLQCIKCIRYRGIFYTIPLYLEFKIIIFSIFRQVSGVKSKLIRFLDFLKIFGFLDV